MRVCPVSYSAQRYSLFCKLPNCTPSLQPLSTPFLTISFTLATLFTHFLLLTTPFPSPAEYNYHFLPFFRPRMHTKITQSDRKNQKICLTLWPQNDNAIGTHFFRGVAQLAARHVRDVEVGSSSLLNPTIFNKNQQPCWFLFSLFPAITPVI